MTSADLDDFPYERFRRRVRAWYVRHGRMLPWRAAGDPYVVWISEIMLQQTTVTAVVPYFERFLSRFPTLDVLAAAAEEDVLRSWEGLGYYTRARNLHQTARTLVAGHNGRFPESVEALCDLPGIGRYTAGAIASFAFNQRAPILEANTVRLAARLVACEDDPRSAGSQRLLWKFAERVLPARGVGMFNQALMDLGATICRPEPTCAHCPVRDCCRAAASGRQTEIPQRTARPAMTDVSEVAVAIQNGDAFLVRQRTPGERWSGLYDFVRLSGPAPLADVATWISQQVLEQSSVTIQLQQELPEIRHVVTRFRITLRCWMACATSGTPAAGWKWVSHAELVSLPLSRPARRLAGLLPVSG